MEAYQRIQGLSGKRLEVELAELITKPIEARTAMLYAAMKDDASFLSVMHERGIELSISSKEGNGLAHFAAEQNSVNVIRFLAKHSADLNSLNAQGQAPIHRAAATGQHAAFKALAQAGANACLKEERHGMTPMAMFDDPTALYGPNWKCNPLEDVLLKGDTCKAIKVMWLFETDHKLKGLVQDLNRKYPALPVEKLLPELEAGRYRALAICPDVSWGRKG